MFQRPHRRLNPLTGQWLIVSPQVAKEIEVTILTEIPADLPEYEPDCDLCPGNKIGKYRGIKVIDDDTPQLDPDRYRPSGLTHQLYQAMPARGIAKTIIFAPEHNMSLANLKPDDLEELMETWVEQTREIEHEHPWVDYIQIFEQRGGTTTYHPHCKVWATASIPDIVKMKDRMQRNYYYEHGSSMLAEIIQEERGFGQRLVATNAEWTAFVPFWAKTPFEVMLATNQQTTYLKDLSEEGRNALGSILQTILKQYRQYFHTEIGYTLGIHQAALHDDDQRHWHLHAHIYPAVRPAILSGYDQVGMVQRDMTPETMARLLRGES